jgi:hypothetical protein
MADDDVQFSPDWDLQVMKAARPLMRKVLQDVADDMLRTVPRDTGELADSINPYATSGNRYRIKIGTDHWVHVEYGTRYMAAQPYIRPSVYKKRSL